MLGYRIPLASDSVQLELMVIEPEELAIEMPVPE
jgi:hypothetical protein